MRYFLLLLAAAPFVLVLLGVIGAICFWGMPPYRYLSMTLFVIAFFVPNQNSPFIQRLYGRNHKSLISSLDEKDWISAEFEMLGTEDKLHLVPDDIGIIAKKDGKILIGLFNGNVTVIPAEVCKAIAKARTLSSSVRLVNKVTGAVCSGMSITPYYKGEDLEIAGYPRKKVEWFAQWLGIPLELERS